MIEIIAGCVAGGVVLANLLLRLLVGSYRGGECDFTKGPITLIAWGEFNVSEWSLGPILDFTDGTCGYYEFGIRINAVCIHVGASVSKSPGVEEMKRRLLAGKDG